MAELLNLGTSALLSLQRAISTTGHNIANANTEGYNRQTVSLTTQPPQFLGGEYFGSGVSVDAVERYYDQFISSEVRNRTSSQAGFQFYYEMASRLDSLMADPSVGLGPVIESFFGAVQDVANNPGSAPERRVLLGEAQGLADRFHYLDSNFENLSSEVNGRIESSVIEINSLVDGIADLNRQVARTQAMGSGQAANDLLDSRDLMINELAQYVSVSTLEQSDGSVNVMIGNGQPLVVGQTATHLQTLDDPADPTRVLVAAAGSGVDLSRSVEGGQLGALLSFREQTLDPARNQLGLLATGLAATFNDQHHLGLDLQGQLGGDFFQPLDATQIANANNSGLSAVSATIDDVAALTGDDYKASYVGGQWVLTNLSTEVSQTGSGPFSVDGLTIAVSGTPAEGDSFLIQPTRQAANQFAVVLNDPAGFAAASPVRAEAALSNGGSGEVSGLAVTSTTGLPLASGVTLTFNPDALGPGVPGYEVVGIAGGPLAFDPATESNGKTVTLGDFEVTLSGVPQSGDTLTIDNNVNGSGDNRNVIALASLQTSRSLFDGTASYQDAYGNLVVNIGVQASQAETTSRVEGILLEQSISARDSLSGVNLDEEAANLIRYQQAYQAAAQTIAVADQLFQTLLNATQR